MSEPFDVAVPLTISHNFQLTDDLSITPEIKEKFRPLPSAGEDALAAPSAVTVGLALRF